MQALLNKKLASLSGSFALPSYIYVYVCPFEIVGVIIVIVDFFQLINWRETKLATRTTEDLQSKTKRETK